MLWQNKEISKLTDGELWAAIQSVAEIDNFRFDKLQDERINTQGHRLQRIFTSNPPVENPTFTNLINELKSEWKKRDVKNS